VFAELEEDARKDLHAESFRNDQIGIERALDMRYAGQGYELTVPCGSLGENGGLAALRRTFDESHKQMFGHTAPEEPVEIVSYRLRGVGRVPPVKLPSYRRQGHSLNDALRETRKARFGGVTVDCPVYQRDRLDVGVTFDGPAIIDQLDATTVVPPGQSARVDEFKNILITVGRA
jgi:N-methylhydantoinase A